MGFGGFVKCDEVMWFVLNFRKDVCIDDIECGRCCFFGCYDLGFGGRMSFGGVGVFCEEFFVLGFYFFVCGGGVVFFVFWFLGFCGNFFLFFVSVVVFKRFGDCYLFWREMGIFLFK